MSWVVQHLLRNRLSIRSEPDIESDDFNDLIVIEKKVDDLYKEGFLSDMDLYIIELIADGRPLRNLESSIDKNRITISKTFIQICDRISYFLGGYFTDDGFLENMRVNYRLSNTEIKELESHIRGKFKHKLMKRKI